jgi:hypothetical protein
MGFDRESDSLRWVAYFDLLGTRELIRCKRQLDVFIAYERAIERLESLGTDHSQVRYTWFSDTFLLVTTDDSGGAFVEIESVARWFAYFLIDASVPFRGAIACGQMYADFADRIFIGEALVEAYEYGEGQDWVGFMLCPSSMAQMQHLGIPADERLYYALWAPVWKREPTQAPARIAACLLGSWITLNGANPCLTRLRQMASCQPPTTKPKYDRAIEFIEQHPRSMVVDG